MGDKVQELEDKVKSLENKIQSMSLQSEDNNPTGELLDQEVNSEGRLLNKDNNIKAMNEYLQDLTLHEYQKVNNILEKDHRQNKETFMDESLDSIMNNTVNFLSNSVENMYQKYHEAETLQDKSSETMNYIEKSKLYLLAFVLFVRDDKNVIYLGIICIILSIIIYFFNITTS